MVEVPSESREGEYVVAMSSEGWEEVFSERGTTREETSC